MSMKLLLVAISTAAAAFYCGTAGAAVSLAAACSAIPCVYAATGTPVGIPVGVNVLTHKKAGVWYTMNYSTSLGFDQNLLLVFGQASCAGTPYMALGSIIGPADK